MEASTIEKIKQRLKKDMDKFKGNKVERCKYRFVKEKYNLLIKYPRIESGLIYKSYSVADRDGVNEFKKFIYPNGNRFIETLIKKYKNRVLNKFIKIENTKGNYYYDYSMEILNILNLYIEELLEIKKDERLKKILEEIDLVPNTKFSSEKGRYALEKLKTIEKTDIVGEILEEIEEESWFECYVDVKKGKNDKGKIAYEYSLQFLLEKYSKSILNKTGYVLNSFEWIEKLLGDVIEDYNKQVDFELNKFYKKLNEIC